ncbi:hypothetical protein Ancab_036372 [Ancistrocladus abbreviatus]
MENSDSTAATTSDDICCEVFPITSSPSSGPPTHIAFFHRGRVVEGNRGRISGNAGVGECFLDSWEKHLLRHHHAASGSAVDRDGCKSWPPSETVCSFDERVGLVISGVKDWVKMASKVGCWSIPIGNVSGFSFKLGSLGMNALDNSFHPKNLTVADPTISWSTMHPRCIFQLVDLKKSEHIDTEVKISEGESFKVLSYNILSDVYVTEQKYICCPPWALTWEYRWHNLLHEIMKYDADILSSRVDVVYNFGCQVQSDHFEKFFKPELSKCGYSAIYKNKTDALFTGNGYVIDGCATFFRSAQWVEVRTYELEYGGGASSLIDALESRQGPEARIRLSKNNVAVAVILDMVGNSSVGEASQHRVCVANTHIHSSKQLSDVKLYQVAYLISELEKIVGSTTPLLICGDMNSEPKSGPYSLLVNGKVDHTCLKEETDPLGIYQHLKLQHSLGLASAYSALLKPGHGREDQNILFFSQRRMMDQKTGEPLFTNWSRNFKGTLDYIFYTGKHLKVEGLLELPRFESIGTSNISTAISGAALPSPCWSSDHIALMASFKFTNSQ